ncbi:endonuclease III [Alphaproteobacteria bacterium]|nr:endonuclease III [Alphaproteobacteria bacterium]
MNQQIIIKIFEKFKQNNPNPKSELSAPNDYTFCISVLLSAQTTDKSVNKVTEELFKIADTPEKILGIGEDKLKNYIKSLGFFNVKAKNIMLLSKFLVEKYQSNIPNKREELEKLPGIGRKSANVILNRIFNFNFIGVDTHVLRVSNRIGLTTCETPMKVEQDLIKIVPIEFHKNASDWLVLHGRYVCVARKPKCSECFLKEFCKFATSSNL